MVAKPLPDSYEAVTDLIMGESLQCVLFLADVDVEPLRFSVFVEVINEANLV